MIALRASTALRWPELLVPLWIAEGVCAEVACYLGVDLPERYPAWLTARAERCFRRNATFRASMHQSGNRGRDALRVFLRHWVASLLLLERPDLHRALPPEFDLGQPLSAGPVPHTNRRSSLPLPKPMDWNPERVLRHRHWRFLADTAIPGPPSVATTTSRRKPHVIAPREHELRMADAFPVL